MTQPKGSIHDMKNRNQKYVQLKKDTHSSQHQPQLHAFVRVTTAPTASPSESSHSDSTLHHTPFPNFFIAHFPFISLHLKNLWLVYTHISSVACKT